MTGFRRFAAALLLVCVSLALGDAPYVDEWFESSGTPTGTTEAGMASHPDDVAPSTVSLKLCQNLLVLSCGSEHSPIGELPYVDRFARHGAVPFSSISPRRVDRPPTSLA